MVIHTQQSFSGFIASQPQLTYTENGDARLFVKVGGGQLPPGTRWIIH